MGKQADLNCRYPRILIFESRVHIMRLVCAYQLLVFESFFSKKNNSFFQDKMKDFIKSLQQLAKQRVREKRVQV